MSNFPDQIDSDADIYYVSDNVTEISGANFNQVRDAIFKIEDSLGEKFVGSMNSLAEFLNVSFNPNGTIKGSALTSVGLVTLPIDNSQVGINAGIIESKLSLDFPTASLFSMIQTNATAIAGILSVNNQLSQKLNLHITGGPASDLRHVASHIDLNSIPNDIRDPSYIWTGLFDKNNNLRSASNVSSALLQINDDLVSHEKASYNAHPASAITVNSANFTQISSATNVQEALEELDGFGEISLGIHKSTQHSAGVPADQRTEGFKITDNDGYIDSTLSYGPSVVSPKVCSTYVADFPGTYPVDSTINGDDIISFNAPTNPSDVYKLDSEFVQVRVGDIVRVTYDGYAVESVFTVESIRFTPGSEWVVRINGTNLYNTTASIARIDRALFDNKTQGILAAAVSNATPISSFSGFLSSVTVADPKSAMALGNGFDPNQINDQHYKLYIQLYPTGKPSDKIINLPGIDITGNLGATPGKYTLSSLVESANNAFRSAGYNYRFLAFDYNGNFGISMTDSIDGASFSIVSGDMSSGTLLPGSYTQNIIGDSTDGFDALGFGQKHASIASPAYRTSFPSSIEALTPTIIIHPRKRQYIVNGSSRDYLLSGDGYSDSYFTAEITNKVISGVTVEITYTIEGLYDNIGLKKGKTITVQPSVSYTDPLYKDSDYGRFIIKDVIFVNGCPSPKQTIITVINGVANIGSATGLVSDVGLPVKIYYGNDTVGFNIANVIDDVPLMDDYHRLHEILVTKDARTFSHERARIKVQAASGVNLGTSFFHITDVSPKLKGYYESPPSFKKYVRFYVTNYNSTSGEFDGYLGRRDPLNNNIYDTGVLVTARKNIPTRFYDVTGVDFIEMKFDERATIPTTINYPAYVDIELFDSLTLNDEYLRIATVEVNWQPNAGEVIAQNLVDRRPFGSISELEFTETARDFITSGDRLLHSNGVIRGFDVNSYSPSSGEVLLKGGVALVDGNVVTANEGNVTIPQVYSNVATPPASVTWAVCVNKDGNFETIILSATKAQYFAKSLQSGQVYYIPSVTFSELVSQRSDLCVLYILNVTIASVTINSINDARKKIYKETSNIPLSVGANDFISVVYDGDTEVNATFSNFEQLKTWALYRSSITPSNGKGILVKVKGNIIINNLVDLTGVSSGITFDGEEGCYVQINSQIGFKVRNNVEFKNINFIYEATLTAPIAGDLAHFASDKGAIYIDGNIANCSNVKITNCSFSRTVSSERSPYIYGKLYGSTFDNINISNNRFTDTTTSQYNCSIGLHFILSGMIRNSVIESNISNSYQSIILTQNNIDSFHHMSNVLIKNNLAGMIAVTNSGVFYGKIDVESNACVAIINSDAQGKYQDTFSSTLGTGVINITSNNCSIIHLAKATTDNRFGVLNIKNNTLTSRGLSAVSIWNISAPYYGIKINGIDNGTHTLSIDGNQLNSDGNQVNDYYSAIILIGLSGSVTNNCINKCFSFIGIEGSWNSGTASDRLGYKIIGNSISRGSKDITRYISEQGNGDPTERSIITDNVLDSQYIGGPSPNTATISYLTTSVVERNINHIQRVNVRLWNVFKVCNATTSGDTKFEYGQPTTGVLSIRAMGNNGDAVRVYFSASAAGTAVGFINFADAVPLNAKIKTVSTTVFTEGNVDFDSGTATMRLCKVDSGTEQSNTTYLTNMLGQPNTLSINATPDFYIASESYLEIGIFLARPTDDKYVSVGHTFPGAGILVEYYW